MLPHSTLDSCCSNQPWTNITTISLGLMLSQSIWIHVSNFNLGFMFSHATLDSCFHTQPWIHVAILNPGKMLQHSTFDSCCYLQYGFMLPYSTITKCYYTQPWVHFGSGSYKSKRGSPDRFNIKSRMYFL